MSFASDLQKFSKKTKLGIDEIIVTAIFQLNELTIMATPVDLGQAKGGWIASIGSPSRSEGPFDISGTGTVAKANMVATRAPGNIYYLVNNVGHIRYLEYGTDTQPPKAMVRKSVAAFKQSLNRMVI